MEPWHCRWAVQKHKWLTPDIPFRSVLGEIATKKRIHFPLKQIMEARPACSHAATLDSLCLNMSQLISPEQMHFIGSPDRISLTIYLTFVHIWAQNIWI